MTEQLPYGVTIERIAASPAWRVTECRHLTPEENRGGQNVFVKAFEEDGRRAQGAQIAYRRGDGQPVGFASLDKPDNPAMEKGHGNIPIYPNDTITFFLVGHFDSDIVSGIHTRHPDEHGPNGETWNSWGHHSWIVTFWRMAGSVEPEPEKPTEPEPDPDQLAALEATVAALTQRVVDLETHIFNQQGEL